MNALTYLMIGYGSGCIAAGFAVYWAMRIHINQHYTRNRVYDVPIFEPEQSSETRSPEIAFLGTAETVEDADRMIDEHIGA